MEALKRMLSQYNKLGGAELTAVPSPLGQDLSDISRGGRVLASGLTYEEAACGVSVLEQAKRQDMEEKAAELESLLETIRSNDDCPYGGDVELEIAALRAALNG